MKLLKKSLANKLIIGVSIVHAVLMTIFVGQFVFEHKRGLENEFRSQSIIYARLAAHSAKQWVLASDFVGLEELAGNIQSHNVEYIEFLNANGRVLYHSNKNLVGQFVVDSIDVDHLASDQASSLFENSEKLILSVPIKINQEVKGWANISFLKGDLLSKISTLIWDGFFYSIMAIIIGAILAWFLVQGITVDLKKIINVTTMLRTGNSESRVQLNREDELQVLAHNFNLMLDHLQDEEHQKKIMQAQIIDASKMASLGELAAGIAHEVNNPLAIISGSASMLKEYERSERDQKFLNNIIQSVDRISHIVKNLKMYSHLDIQEDRVFDVGILVQQTLDMISPIYGKDFISIGMKNNCSKCLVFGNRGHLQQILLNLLSNARHAIAQTKKGIGTIQVHIDKIKNNLVIDVMDTGPGISEIYQDKIFESFFTTKPKGVGTGLGLAICQHLIENMHGKLELLSSSEHGATFRITLPLTEKELVTESNHDQQIHSSSSGSILILEDEEHWSDILVLWLMDNGFRCKTVSSIADFNIEIENERYDFYIFDYLLPDGLCSEVFEDTDQFNGSNSLILTGEMDLQKEIISKLKLLNINVLYNSIDKSKRLASVTSCLSLNKLQS
ncbi:MAG: hypothetical protein OHK0056_17010 [Bacteriovoracaceae bacterium]